MLSAAEMPSCCPMLLRECEGRNDHVLWSKKKKEHWKIHRAKREREKDRKKTKG